jgi:uncharacterized protein YqhQ
VAVSAYGGQAVMEGVMMRGPAGMAVAVRLPDGEIRVDTLARPLPAAVSGWWRLPILRGLAALADSLSLGTRALLFSAELVAAAEAPGGSGGPAPVTGRGRGRPLVGSPTAAPSVTTAGAELGWTVALALAVAVGLFVLAPAVLAGRLRGPVPPPLAEGLVRIGLLLGYLVAVGAAPDVRRILQFHGAEHKAIAALEGGLPLEVDAVAGCSRFHPRCGTSFLLFVVLLAGVGFPLIAAPSPWVRLGLRVALLPLLAGAGYELLRASAAPGRPPAWAALPGLWLQRLTTREPDRGQVEVALAALHQVLAMEGRRPEAGAVRAAVAGGALPAT